MPSKVIVRYMAAILFTVVMSPGDASSQATFSGPPTVGGLLGETVAENLVEDYLEMVVKEHTNPDGTKAYFDALAKYEKGLRDLQRKHAKKRANEEKVLQGMIDDLARYTPGDPNVNRKQEEKQRKIYEYARQCQANDQGRAKEVQVYREQKEPRLESFRKSY